VTVAARGTEAATTSAPTFDPSGSRAASAELARLFEAHARRVRLICLSMLRDAHEADDALQQTFLSAYRSLLGGSVPRDAAAWLATIARNECRARIRDRMATPLAAVEVETLVSHTDAADAAAERERLAAVLAAVGALPERERQAVVLQAFAGASNAEVAARLGTTESAVESILVRARAQLRARAWPVVAGARALALAPVSWARALLFTPGGSDVVAVAKVGTAMAVVGTLVAVGPSVGTHANHAHGRPAAPPLASNAAPVAREATDPGAVVSAGRAQLRPSPVVAALRPAKAVPRGQRPPHPVATAASASAPARTEDSPDADDAGETSVASASPSAEDHGSSGPSATSGSDDGTAPGGDSGPGSGPGPSGSGSDASGSHDGGTDGATGETSGSASGSHDGDGSSTGGGAAESSSGSGGSGSQDPPADGSSGSGSTSGSSEGSTSGSEGSGGSGGSGDTTVTTTTGGEGDHH
jgi:RNA polymerase sigma factor (sigma-70 family)